MEQRKENVIIYKTCPKCESHDIAKERTINGYTICCNCQFRLKHKEWEEAPRSGDKNETQIS